MVRVDFQRHVFKLFLGHFDVGVGVDLEAPDDVLVRYLLTGLGVDARIPDAMAGVLVDLIEADFSESAVAGNKGIGQLTRERRKKHFQLARGAIQNTRTQQNLDSRRSCRVGLTINWRHFLKRTHLPIDSSFVRMELACFRFVAGSSDWPRLGPDHCLQPSSHMRCRRRVNDERSNTSRCWMHSSPQKSNLEVS
jgi:hypothetical protein